MSKTLFNRFVFSMGLAGALLVPAGHVQAQTSDLPSGGSYNIESGFNPTLASAKMQSFPAQLPPTDTAKANMTYSFQTRLLHIPFKPADLKPLALGKDNTKTVLQNNLLELGAGNHLSGFALARYNSGASAKINYGFAIDHLSSNSSKLDFQQYSDSRFNVYASVTGKKAVFNADVTDVRNVVYFYGYDHSDTALHFAAKDLKRRFNDAGILLDLKNARQNSADIDYSGNAAYHLFSDNLGASESTITAGFSLVKSIHKIHRLGLGLAAISDMAKDDSVTLNRFQFSFNPNYTYKTDGGFIRVGMTGIQQDQSFYVFPDFDSEKKLIGEKLIYYATTNGRMTINSIKSLTDVNPFLVSDPQFKVTRENNTYTGFKGCYGAHFSYNLGIEQQSIRNYALFLSDTADPRRFMVTYDNRANIINLVTELGWKQNEKLNAIFRICYRNYDLDTAMFAYGHSAADASLSVNYAAWKNIEVTSVLFYHSGIFVNRTVKTKDIIDANLSATYNYQQNFLFFIKLNNISAQPYQRWYNYPSYRFTVLAGAGVRF